MSLARVARGFRATGVRCGIKKKAGALDLAVIASTKPCSAAAVFTQNQLAAGPVVATRTLVQRDAEEVYGVVVNSGVANAATGQRGVKDAFAMSKIAEREVGVRNALVMSTGVIGPFLDMEKIERGAKLAAEALPEPEVADEPDENGNMDELVDGWQLASRAIMTTDSVPKLVSNTFSLPSDPDRVYTITGIAKGSGMIHPNMATMLGAVVTDAQVTADALQSALTYAADRSFNAISVDGDTSTNDTVTVLANAASAPEDGSGVIDDVQSADFNAFQDALSEASTSLAEQLVRDGEGATKFITITVRGGRTHSEAMEVANSIATSNLFKAACYGEDANWGRILCAVGYSKVPVDMNVVDMWFCHDAQSDGSHNEDLQLVRAGAPFEVDEERATALLQGTDINILVDLHAGEHTGVMWTTDLSKDYVSINADKRS